MVERINLPFDFRENDDQYGDFEDRCEDCTGKVSYVVESSFCQSCKLRFHDDCREPMMTSYQNGHLGYRCLVCFREEL